MEVHEDYVIETWNTFSPDGAEWEFSVWGVAGGIAFSMRWADKTTYSSVIKNSLGLGGDEYISILNRVFNFYRSTTTHETRMHLGKWILECIRQSVNKSTSQ
jgi:hypothetical protein